MNNPATESKHTPTGFVATCRCGQDVGALDLTRSRREDTSRLLGDWLMRGCTVSPRFGSSWRAALTTCECAALHQSTGGADHG